MQIFAVPQAAFFVRFQQEWMLFLMKRLQKKAKFDLLPVLVKIQPDSAKHQPLKINT